MKNVVINKIVKYVFTEDQMKGLWQRLKKEPAYDKLTNEQVIQLAKRIMEKASHSELEEYTVDSAWRLPTDSKGEIIAQDDSNPTEHVELIDTDLPDNSINDMVIDRMMKLYCQTCAFEFYIEDLEAEPKTLHCPKCSGAVSISQRGVRTLKEEN
ncbi:hypothetical protein GCM10011391_22660 [Pullulanibacillus camelliae]|uniref:Uncharacterized protein n=1 Tax=Pullulanibacillus camelliae TaxID=1707096 RepID=A0A8J2YHV0_9BACL|nr:hypothetical protein [Pullulanibacillus camelliae]GGE43317.1 hypothetical protein GCM10011391_22660 [Pullulanibacillus camelliae]